MKEQFDKHITEELLINFRAITGDNNPLHLDREYAQQKGYNDKIIFGMLTASFLSTLAGMYLPGKYSLIHKTDVNFHKPVYVGDVLTVNGTVNEKDDRFKTLRLKVNMKNQKNEKVLSGSMRIGVTK